MTLALLTRSVRRKIANRPVVSDGTSAREGAAGVFGALSPRLFLSEIVASLPLQRGFYVSAQATCATASNATLMLVTRTGMNVSGVITSFRKIDKVGPTTYVVTAVSEELDGRPGPSVTLTYEVPNATTFRGREGSGTYEYRHCPQTSLPAPWRDNDIRDVIR